MIIRPTHEPLAEGAKKRRSGLTRRGLDLAAEADNVSSSDDEWPAAGRTFGPLLVRRADTDAIATERPYLVKGLMSPGETSVIFGEPGSAKTFLALHINHALAQGRPIFGLRIQQAPILYLGLEGEVGIQLRIAALARRFGPAPAFHFIAQPINLFSNTTALDAVRDAALATEAQMITIDTLSQAYGEGNENDPGDSGRMRANLNALRATTGAHICVLHHPGKNTALGPRGHSSLLGAVDMALEIVRAETGERTATLKKLKDGIDGTAFCFDLQVDTLGYDQDGDAVTTCTVKELDAPQAVSGAKLTGDEAGWLADLVRLFGEPDISARRVRPTPDMQPLRAATRDEIRAWLQRVGRVGVAGKDALDATDRSRLSRFINRLKDKGKIGILGDWLWLIQ
ncbi:MAG: AAA family ATPase [Alphaproteobacteria bacterium]|nr:AAA family ATPase [Alphaproteobacteria bacterium]